MDVCGNCDRRDRTIYQFLLVGLLGILTLTGCLSEDSQSGSEGGTDVISEPAPAPVLPPLTTPERTICDPFQVGPSARDRGLVGNLLYLTDSMPRYSSVSDYIQNAEIVQSTLYFDRLFIPTRPFDRGFSTQTGQLIVNADGDPIYEYFAVRLESQLKLAANELPGSYQLALLSDDGAVMKLKNSDETETVVVNNDGTHPTRMGCGSTVNMTTSTKLPFILEYFQGPRYHISLVMLWRPLPDGSDPDNPVVDPRCGQAGNSLFFDSTQDPVVAQSAFYEMLSRGWKVLENDNFYFPEQALNPCAPTEEPLQISFFSIVGSTRNSVTVTWTTNLPATSMAEARNITTGASTPSALDSTLVISHRVTISGLLPNTLYSIKATSTSAGNQTVQSDERAIRTPR